MPWLPPVLIGLALWSCAAWAAHPRDLWDAPAFWTVWGAAIFCSLIFATLRPDQALRQTALVFLPLIPVMVVSALIAGGGEGVSLVPAVVLLALPAWGLALLLIRLRDRD